MQVSLPTQYNGKTQDPVGALSGALARLQASRPLRELREIAKGVTKQLPEPVQVRSRTGIVLCEGSCSSYAVQNVLGLCAEGSQYEQDPTLHLDHMLIAPNIGGNVSSCTPQILSLPKYRTHVLYLCFLTITG